MKKTLNNFLCKYPYIYKNILKITENSNYEKQFYLTHIKSNDVVFELGANRGYFTSLFCNIVGNQGQVHAFEAVPETYNKTKQSFAINYPKNLFFNNYAVGNENKSVDLFMPNTDDGQASLANQNDGSWKTGFITIHSSQMIRLDDYIHKNKILKIDFVKCDIEGSELLALQGMEESLKQFKPKILVEVHESWMNSFNYSSMDLFESLRKFGYTEFHQVENTIKRLSLHELENVKNLPESMNVYCK